MFSIFNKKKNELAEEKQEPKKRSLDFFEADDESTVLEWGDMGKIEGGKSAVRPLRDVSSLQFTFSGTIPQ